MLEFFGYLISAFFLIASITFFIMSIIGYLWYSENSSSPVIPLKVSFRYMALSWCCFTTMIIVYASIFFDTSWKDLISLIFFSLGLLAFISFTYFMRLKFSTRLYKEDVPFSELLKNFFEKDDLIEFLLRIK